MNPIIIATIVGVMVYLLVLALIPRRFLREASHTRSMLDRLENETAMDDREEGSSLFRDEVNRSGAFNRIFFALPFAEAIHSKLLRAGLGQSIEKFFLSFAAIFCVLLFLLHGGGVAGVISALAITVLLGWFFIKHRINKRNRAFLAAFPDALDMIVRSVRSGYPLNSAVRMVAENMQAPVSTEFRQVADETAYGSSLIESLQRLSQRIDEPDIRFFVVVLSVQQEVGGNLAEVLSNLSTIIRKRKHLHLKIRALSSEGRATAWVLGSLPVLEFLAIYLVSPKHLDPLFTTQAGNMLLMSAVGIVLFGVFLVKQIINIEV